MLNNFISYALESGFSVAGITGSPIRGPEGNIEFLAHLTVGNNQKPVDVEDVVATAHEDWSDGE